MRANQNNRTLVVIPWLASAAQGDELCLAVTGWHEFFREPHQIVIVGDCPSWCKQGVKSIILPNGAEMSWQVDPEWDFDIKLIYCPRIMPVPGQYTPALDHINKFRRVREAFPDTDGFIYTCDDIYPVAPFTLDDVKVPKYPEIHTKWLEEKDWDGKTDTWWGARGYTAKLCRDAGLPVRDWVCHMPVYYEWDRLLDIFDRYDADHHAIIPENIYFNMYTYFASSQPATDWRDEVTTASPCLRPLGTVTWVTNQNSGWSERLESMLKKHYGLV